MKKVALKLFFLELFILGLLNFSGCKDVGLGESVDTKAPTVKITYPPSLAIIRDSFVLYGDCWDDKNVKTVKVSVSKKNEASDSSALETILTDIPAQIDQKQQHWSLTLNNYDNSDENSFNGWQLADGTYVITVTVSDGQSSISDSRTFDIDNTAPVFVIKNPGVLKTGNTSPSAYGSIFTIEGTISELHAVTSMDVTIFNSENQIVSRENYDGEELDSFREENIEISGGTSVIIAQSGNDAGNRYSQIYGENQGTRQFTCSIKLTDDAKRYVCPPESSVSRTVDEISSDETGNSTCSLYLYDDVYDSLLSQKNASSIKLTAGDLKNVINGTLKNDSALSILKAAEKDTNSSAEEENKRLYFSLNPDANPTYQVNGFEYNFGSSTNQQASAGNAVSITVSQGLDQTQIDLDGNEKSNSTVKVWMKEFSQVPESEDALKSEIIEKLAVKVKGLEDEGAVFTEYAAASEEKTVTDLAEGWKLIYDYSQHNSGESSVSTKTFSVTLPESSIVLEKFYFIAVTGRDIDNVEFAQNKVYGFEGNEAGVPPTLTLEPLYWEGAAGENPTANLLPSSDFTFKGTATLKSGSLFTSLLKATITVTNQETNTVVASTWTQITRPSLDKSWENTEAFNCDNDGTWTLSLSKLPDYDAIAASENKSYLYTLELYGKASSGHYNSISQNVQVDTKSPVVEITSITPTVDEYDGKTGPFVNGKIFVKGTVEETNLENVSVEVWAGENLVDSASNASLGKMYSINYEIETSKLTDDSALDVKLIAVDKVGNKTTYSSASAEGSAYKKLKIWEETDRPVITLSNASDSEEFKGENGASSIGTENGNLFGTISNNKLSASITDDDSIVTVKVTVYDAKGNLLSGDKVHSTYGNPYLFDVNKSTCSLSYILPSEEGVYQICIEALDYLESETNSKETGKGSTGIFFFAVSAGAPAINVDYVNTYQTEKPVFSGSVSSKEASVSASFISAKIGETAADVDAQTLKTLSENLTVTVQKDTTPISWTCGFKENTPPLENGSYGLVFTAHNRYGETNSAKTEFIVDNKSPSLTLTEYNSKPSPEEGGYTGTIDFYLNPANIKTLKGTCQDDVSGIDSVFYKIKDYSEAEIPSTENGWLPATLTKDNDSTKWTVSLTDLGLAENERSTVHIKARDKAGNFSPDCNIINLIIDSTAPKTSLTGTNLFDSTGSGTENGALTDGSTYFAKENFTLTGTLEEENAATIKINGKEVTLTDKNWTFTPEEFKEGTSVYKIALADEAENQSEYALTITYDTTAPTLALTSPLAQSNIPSNSIPLAGSVSDTGSGVKQLDYTIQPLSGTGTTLEESHNISQSGNWNIENLNLSAEGKYRISVKARDVLGNTSDESTVEFYYDNTAPNLTASVSDEAKFTYTQEEKTFKVYGSNSFNIEAEVSDAVSDVSSVTANSTTALVRGEDGKWRGTVIVNPDENGNAKITVVAADKFNNISTQIIEDLFIDTKAPEFLGTIDFPQNPTKNSFILKGTVTDNLGAQNIESIIITDSIDSSKSYQATLTGEGSNVSWSVTLTPDAQADDAFQTKDGIHTYTITASDKPGNKSSVNCQVTTDTTAPFWYTGNVQNTEPSIITKSSAEKITSGGTEYSLYNSSTINIAAKAKDATTTEIKLLYKVNDADEWTSSDNGSLEIESGIKEGINSIKIKAVDEALNENNEITLFFFADRSAPRVPELKSVDGISDSTFIENLKNQVTNKLVNRTEAVTFTVEVEDTNTEVSDTFSGIASVQLTEIGNSALSSPIGGNVISSEGNKSVYEITLPTEEFATGSVTVTVKDKAGNSTKSGLFNLRVDDIPPAISLTAPKDADTSTTVRDVNKSISLSGRATDTMGLDTTSLKLKYSTDNITWNELSSSTAGEKFAVSLRDSVISVENLDTTKFTDKSTIYIQATIRDEAQNSAESNVLELYVNQDSDRPIVKISNLVKLSDRTLLLKHGTNAQVSGTITDDDSDSETQVIEKLVISESPYTGTETQTPEDKADFNPSTGEFTFTPSDTTDGEKNIYFYLKDIKGGEFYTTATVSSYLANPKLYLKGEKLADDLAAEKLVYKSDSNNPTVTASKCVLYSDQNGENPAVDSSGTEFSFENANSTLNNSFVAGGLARRYAKFRFEAKDSSGIEGMTLELFDENNNSVLKLKTSDEITDAEGFVTNGTCITYQQDSTVSVWETGIIDLNGLETGQYTAKLTPYDKAGLSGNGNHSFSIDNSAPSIIIRSPVSNSEVTGVISIAGTANDTGSAGTKNLQWLIPTKAELSAAAAMTNESKQEYLKNLNWNGGEDSLSAGSTPTTWQFDFDGKNNNSTSDPENFIFKGGNPVLEVYDTIDFASSIVDGVYTLPVLFMATDSIGNYSIYENYTLRHNPDGDKPKLNFLYPTVSDYGNGQNYAVLGGTIRATGSAIIPSGTTTVNSVYYQIADENGLFTETDKTTAKTTYGYEILNAYEVAKAVSGNSYTRGSVSEDVLKKLGFASQTEMDAWWGIKANGTAAWNILLNEKGELNPKNESLTTNITVRVCGVNAEGKFGAWTSGEDVIAIHIDNTAPVISTALKQYATEINSNPETEPSVTASQIYKTDMFLKGDWYLTATLLDETKVTSYSVKKGNTSLEGSYFVQEGVTEGGKKGVRLYIPIDKSSDSVSYTIEANDAEHTAAQTFSFKLDNTAPTLDSLTGNGSDLISGKTVEDSNYVYSIAGKSDDTGSGVERVLFYFMRKKGTTQTTIGNQVILDPMITTGTQDSKVLLSDLTPLEISQGGEKFTLYAKKQTGSATTDTFTLTSEDSHIRTGGLIYIDGLYRKITKIEGTAVTFEPALSEAKDSIEAYFPIAQVIDNSATEKVKSNSSNPFVFDSGDDGDGMPETFSKTGSVWTWDASIHSTNLPDGPVTLVIMAFDEAGNVSGKSYNLMIANNAPRLAKVWLGTDLNNDGKFTSSSDIKEIVEYNILAAEGNEQKEYELDFTAKKSDGTPKYESGIFKIKKDLAVIPEFTGGNGSIGMISNLTATDTTKTTGTVTEASAQDVTVTGTEKTLTSAKFTSQKFAANAKANSIYAFVISENELGDDGEDKGISFTFWDKTEETKQGTNSQYSVLFVKNFSIAQKDNTPPNAVIDPFQWNSLTDNSIYGSETAESFSDLKGHIELEADWKKATGYKASETNGQFDGDPKVSGKITIRGSAYDNTNLTALYAVIDGFTFANTENLSTTDITTTETSVSKTRTMVKLAAYENGSWTVTEGGMDEYGWNFTVTDGGIDQTGHRVIWQLDWDTSKISGIVGADKTIAIAAKDYTGNYSWQTASIHPEDETAHNKPEYRVDVVPYVTEIKNSMLTKKHKSKGSVYGQSSTGGYSVNATETVTIEGFNIGETKTISMSKISTGNYDYTVSGIKALNNYNNNAAHGEASETSLVNFYNKRPNNENNNILTDDIKFYVWETKYGAQSNNGRLSEPVMKIDPTTLQIKFAFRNSADSFSMGGSSDSSTDHSYQVWQGNYAAFRNIAFAIDTNGVTHGIAAGIDTNPQTGSLAAGKLSYFSSKWGTSGSGSEGNYGGTNAIRFDSIGVSSNYKDYVKGVAVSGTIIDEYRYESPVLATTVYNNVTNIYAAYYDSLQGQIRFRYGTLPSSKTNFGQFVDNKTRTNADPGKVPFDAHPDNYSLIAGNDAVDYTTKQTGYKAGSAVAIDAIAGATDVVIAVFTDGQNLYYTYKINPATDYDLGEGGKYGSTSNGTSFTNSGYWSEPKTIFTGGGKYCSIKADALGGIHIAAFDDKVNQDLKYAYLEHYWSNYSEDTDSVIVDGYGITGTHVNIDVQLEIVGSGYKAVPYISYYNDSTCLTKLAYLLPQKDGESITMNYRLSGVDDYDRYTGNWEVIIIPTENEIQQDNTSIGLWKQISTGNIGKVYPSDDADIKAQAGKTTTPTAKTGECYGNGTINPVIAYGITDGAQGKIEIAQLK